VDGWCKHGLSGGTRVPS